MAAFILDDVIFGLMLHLQVCKSCISIENILGLVKMGPCKKDCLCGWQLGMVILSF